MRCCVTIFALCFFAPAAAFPQSAAETKATIAYLQGLQQPDGGFLPAALDPKSDRKALSSLRATTGALRALHYCGSEVKDRAKAIQFVASCFDANAGAFADAPGAKPDVAATAVGLMAVAEMKLDPKPYSAKCLHYLSENAKEFEEIRIAMAGFEAMKRQPAEPVKERWLALLKTMMNDDYTSGSGDGKTRATGSVIVTWLRLDRKIDETDQLRTALDGQRDDGGYGKAEVKNSDLETSYRVMRANHMLFRQPRDVPKMRAFIAKCRNPDGGYAVEPGKPSSAGGVYFACAILHWMKQKSP